MAGHPRSRSLRLWPGPHAAHPSDLDLRITYSASPLITADSLPDCDFAVPLG